MEDPTIQSELSWYTFPMEIPAEETYQGFLIVISKLGWIAVFFATGLHV